VLVAATSTGCATIGLGPPVVVSRQPGRLRQETVATEGVAATVKFEKSVLTVFVGVACVRRGVRTTTITETRDHQNKDSGIDWLLAGTGVAAIGGGSILLADASKTYPNDTSSRQYNPTGPGTERAIGAGLVVLGAIVAGVAGYDGIAASGSETTKRNVEEPEEARGKASPCESHPRGGIPVVLKTSKAADAEITVGTTDKKGNLRVDLVDALPETPRLPTSKTMSVVVDGNVFGTIDIAPVVVAREDAAWKRLYLSSCRLPSTSGSCDAVKKHLEVYPEGTHASEAEALLAASRPKLAALADDEAWAAAGGDDCADPKAADLNHLEAACKKVEGYLNDRMGGAHSEDARKSLKVGTMTIKKLQADQKRAEDEAKRKEEAAARAEAAREQAAAREAAAKVRSKCVGECQIICSQRNFRDPVSCLNGCIARNCNP
jgi:hypothetical protein